MERPTVPNGVLPHLTVSDGEAAIAFYKKAFGATELFRQALDGDKRLLHAELEINGGRLLMSDDFPEMSGNPNTPDAFGGSPVRSAPPSRRR